MTVPLKDVNFQLPCDGTFIADCGATTHIVNKEDCFIDLDESFDPGKHFIELGNGEKSNNIAKKRVTVVIYLHSNENKVIKILLNTLFIPSYPQCIFSVQSATKNGAVLNFKDDSAG